MPSRAKDDLRSHIIDLFFMGYRQPLTLEMLAEKMNLSIKQVNRLLQRHFRTSFKQKLLDTRLEAAKDLLRTTDLPVEQIAGEIGYASPHRFYTPFQKKLGMTPNEYRTRQLTDAESLSELTPI
ncbi:helix-turn-helix transcriptional regulator [Paenibacillus hemerocallicola]|uniref:Helix-turn-helix transcriptional regulator n=1 Tax=Paenibacillus hemerocallicola TaxID=1172614 RepID=A0A5C4SXB4_9BACL|nr:helix-turn-helix transcriptional regulator [Paenibacillus hemerocallicola]TNJ59886.1 helix-turn-helix transcriptional regulator [Paenibacillus hemerocallicola]